MITEKRLEDALTFLSETDVENAESNATVKYLDRLLKRKKHYTLQVIQEIKVYLQKNNLIMLVTFIKMQ